MHTLEEILVQNDPELLLKYLQENSGMHRNYKMYTSMERALDFLVTGDLYLSNGQKWNDVLDRNRMDFRYTFAQCFTYSTKENIAMWMLYSGKRGKNGVLLDFIPSVMKSIVGVGKIEIVKIKARKDVETVTILDLDKKEYAIYLQDILYTDQKKEKVLVTYQNEHKYCEPTLLSDDRVFTKKYEWSYEKECRLVIEPTERGIFKIRKCESELKDGEYLMAKLHVKKYKDMKQRMIKSPVYEGNVFHGKISALDSEIDWEF